MKLVHMMAVAVVVFLVGVSALLSNTQTSIEGLEDREDGLNHSTTDSGTVKSVKYGSAEIKVPAVDENGNGVVTTLKVSSNAGSGGTLVDIAQLLFWVDTQYSIQTAKYVAENFTNADLSEVDLVYSIDTQAYLIEGPSAGAALTVATIYAIYNKTIRPDVMITGTINDDGSIGPVGGIVEKAKAAKDIGASLFIVPEGQSVETYYVQEQTCEDIGPIKYCSTKYVQQTANVTDEAGIEIIEASNIGEALKYFID